MNNYIKLGLVGLGYWGQNYLRIISEHDSVVLKGCVDFNINNLKSATLKRLPNIILSKNYQDLVHNQDINSVIIATPTKTHYQIAKNFLLAKKNVLVEKPLALSVKECQELIDIAEKNKVVLMVGHIFKYHPAVRQIKKLIDRNSLGNLLYFYSSRTGLGIIRDDVNAMWDLAPHDISILLYWFNEKPISVSARGQSYLNNGKKLEDVVFVNIKFANEKMANIHLSWLDPHKTRKITLVGDKKMLIFDDVSVSEKISIYDKGVSYQRAGATFGEIQTLVRDGDIIIPKIIFQEPLKEELNHFIDCVLNNKKPISDGNDGLAVVKILAAAQKSLDEDRVINL